MDSYDMSPGEAENRAREERDLRKELAMQNFFNSLQKSANMVGTIGGKMADTNVMDIKDDQRSLMLEEMMKDRRAKEAEDRAAQRIELTKALELKYPKLEKPDKPVYGETEVDGKVYSVNRNNPNDRILLGKATQKTASVDKPQEQKQFTPEQFKIVGFAKALDNADILLKYYDNTDIHNRKTAEIEDSWLYPERMVDDEVKSINQAQRAFINAKLRRDSGASISPAEFASESKRFFPQPGDSQAVIEQKAAARAQEIATIKAEAGEAYASTPNIPPKVPESSAYTKKTDGATAIAAPVERRIKIQAPDGSVATVPESKRDYYLKKGGKEVQ